MKMQRKDKLSILLLLFLYILQGIPLGLISAVPMILQNRHVSYSGQAKFSFAYWPFSLKLLWAPIVDSLYSERFGRRKTWLVPIQYLLGAFMLLLSYNIDGLLEQNNLNLLTSVFFGLNFLAATQDIAVDGWALTMLSRDNVGYASTCNSVGQTAGYFLGYVVFLALESTDFCNNYLRSTPSDVGLVTFSGFLYFWSIVFVITTTLVMILKSEEKSEDEEKLDLVQSYVGLWRIIKLKSVKRLILFLLTCKIGFAAADAVTGLKLVESGVPKDRLALLAVPMTPLQIVLPLFITKYTAGSSSDPMALFMKAMPIRLIFGLVFAAMVHVTPNFKDPVTGVYPFIYYLILLVIYAFHQVAVYSMFVSVMSFFAKISDPAVGGTYMTLLNTICNLGGNWPSTLALCLVDPLTAFTGCSSDPKNDCSTESLRKECSGECNKSIDGYYVESILCVIFGLIWVYSWGKPTSDKYFTTDREQWTLTPTITSEKGTIKPRSKVI